MDWELIALTIAFIIGYIHLINVTKQRYITAIVRLHLESIEQDTDHVPLKSEQFDKLCRFIVTPVPGMEFTASDIRGAVIKRVIVEEQGYLEVICQLKLTDTDNEFNQTCEYFINQGWSKKHYV